MSKDNIFNGPIFNVTSNNQAGGITAGQINISAPARHINDGTRSVILEKVPHGKPVWIFTVSTSDSETTALAQEIYDYEPWIPHAAACFDVPGCGARAGTRDRDRRPRPK